MVKNYKYFYRDKMLKFYILSITLLSGICLGAQSIKLQVGKKFGIIQETKMTTKASGMGQEVEIGSNITNTSDYEIKKITNSGFTITSVLKHMKLSASIMGQDRIIDSDDSTSRNDLQYGEAFAALNKPYEIEIENKRAAYRDETGENISQMGGVPGIANDQAKLILTQQDMFRLKEGNQWRDSLISDSSRVVYEYTVMKASETITEIFVTATMQINLLVNQMGMEIKQSLKGISNAKRQYNTTNGLLLKEDSDIAINGNMEVLGQSSPMTITGKIITTVTQ